jgi:hypothetical protein
MFYAQVFFLGLAIGVISGMLGIGGGVLLIPGLILLLNFSQQEAQGTSLAAMVPPIGIFAAMVYYQNGHVKIPVAVLVATGFMIGAFVGAMLVPYVAVHWLRLGFGGLLLYVGVAFVLGRTGVKQVAALPAGVALGLMALGAWLRMACPAPKPKSLPAPDDQTEYHI